MDERALIRGLRERREDCAEVFVDRHRGLIAHCVARFEKGPDARDALFWEIAQHVLAEIQRGDFDPERGSLGSWVYRMAWCRCVDHVRRRREEPRPSAALGEALDPRGEPGEQTGREELADLVQRALAQLDLEDPEDAALLRLRFLEGLELTAIGERLDLSLEKVKYRLKQAKNRLRGRLLGLRGLVELPE